MANLLDSRNWLVNDVEGLIARLLQLPRSRRALHVARLVACSATAQGKT